jgi:hypothetical protein
LIHDVSDILAKRNRYKYEIGGSLQWQKEEIRRLEDISDGNEVLNKKKWKHLLKVVKRVGTWKPHFFDHT